MTTSKEALALSGGGNSSAQSQPSTDAGTHIPRSPQLQNFLSLTGLLPFRIVETADYAEVHAANGEPDHAFALTTSPSFFEELNTIAEDVS